MRSLNTLLVGVLITLGVVTPVTTTGHAEVSPRAAVGTAVSPTTGASPTIHDVEPGQSIAAAVDAATPGDIVLVHDGSYPQQTITSEKAATVTVRGTSRTGVHVAGFVVSGATNITFEDLSIDGPIEGGEGKGAMWIKDASSAITLTRVTIDPVSGSGADSTAGVVVAGGSHQVTIEDSSITGARADGGNGRNVLIFGSLDPQEQGDWVHDIVITGNDLSAASADNVQITGAYDVTITHNTLRGVQNNDDHNDGVQSVSSDNLTIAANTITDSDGSYDQGIVLQSGIVAGGCLAETRTTNTFVANNLISHIGGTGIDLAGAINPTIVANTVYDNGDGVQDGDAKPDYALVLFGGSKDTIGCGVNLPQNENVRVWNNVFDSIYRHPTDGGTSFQTSNVIAEAANAQPGDVVADPQFVDRVGYELRATSPAADLGAPIAGNPTDDLNGTPRAVPPDSGAIEIEAAAVPAAGPATDHAPDTTHAPTTTDEPTTAVAPTTGVPTTVGPTSSWSGRVAAGIAAVVLVAGGIALLVIVRRRRHLD